MAFSREQATPVHLPTPEVVVQSGHTHAVQDVAFSPDGSLLATCSNDSSVKLWDIRLGREVRTLLGAVQSLHTVAFSPDGREVAASGPDQTIYRWNTADGTLLDSLSGHSGGVQKIVYGSSGKLLASASYDKTAVIWNVGSATAAQVLQHDQEVVDIALSPDEKLAATFWSDDEHCHVTIWNTANGEKVRTITFESQRGHQLGFSPDGKLLAVRVGRTTDLYATSNWEKVRSVQGSFLTFRASDGAVCTLMRLGVVRFSDAAIGKLISEIETPDAPDDAEVQKMRKEWNPMSPDFPRWDAPAEGTAISNDGLLLASAMTKATIGVWDANTGGVVQELGGRIGVSYGRGGGSMMRPFTIAWSPVAPVFATGDRDLVRLVDLRVGAEPRVISAHKGLVSALVFRPDGKVLATAGEADGMIRLWDPANGNLIREWNSEPAKDSAESLAWSPDGKLLASGHWPGSDQISRVALWDANSGKPVHIWEDQGKGQTAERFFSAGGRISGVGFLEDGKTLVSTHDYFNRISIWDLIKGEFVGSLTTTRTMIHGLAIRPDRKGFAIAAGLPKESSSLENTRIDPWVQCFEPQGEDWRYHRLAGHEQLVHCVAYSPDGKLLASGSGDCTAKLWDNEKREELATLRGHTSDVGSLAFSHDGRYLATAGFDQAVLIWDVEKRALVATYVAFGKDDFVMVTPDNYYTASRQGLKGVVFRIGNRAVPFEQFDARLNRPDIVLGRLGYADMQLVDSYRHAYESRLSKMGLQEDSLAADYQVPTLELGAKPALSTDVRQMTVRVRAADSQHRLGRLLAFDNDVPVWGAAGADLKPLDASQAEMEVRFDLAAGSNKVQLSALNSQGTESLKQTFDIVYQTPSRKPDLYVLAVGVSAYKDPRLKLRYAAKDAADLVGIFQRQHARFGELKVRTICDGEATREKILAGKEFLDGSTIDDQAVVFLAGHGLLDAKRDYYFGTTDIDMKHPAARGVSYQEIEGLLDQIPARRRLLLMDTCHSGEIETEPERATIVDNAKVKRVESKLNQPTTSVKPAAPLAKTLAAMPADATLWAPRGVDLEGDEPNRMTAAAARTLQNELFADLRRGCGGMVISSASGSEFAIESPSWKNGVFTFALLEGLRENKADLDGDGQVRVSELREYVMRRVQELTDGRQTPTSRRENLEIDFPVY
ncbi:MAG TPA: WD40 repeat domain-containing protein [Pirellulales bacterium]